jgi:hypothetical protein
VNLAACGFENSGFVTQSADRNRLDIATPARAQEEAMPVPLISPAALATMSVGTLKTKKTS